MFPESVVDFWAQPLGSLSLCLFALATVLVRRPFTLAYARESTSPEVWDTPAFQRANMVISTAWTLGFAIMTAGAFLSAFGPPRYEWAALLGTGAGISGALAFQNAYRRNLRRRAAEASQA